MLVIMGMLAEPGGRVWEGFLVGNERRLRNALRRREMVMRMRMVNQISMFALAFGFVSGEKVSSCMVDKKGYGEAESI